MQLGRKLNPFIYFNGLKVYSSVVKSNVKLPENNDCLKP